MHLSLAIEYFINSQAHLYFYLVYGITTTAAHKKIPVIQQNRFFRHAPITLNRHRPLHHSATSFVKQHSTFIVHHHICKTGSPIFYIATYSSISCMLVFISSMISTTAMPLRTHIYILRRLPTSYARARRARAGACFM